MARRPLVATVVTTTVGALLGAVLGAIVGRVIAFFGDATVQTSVPMIFCGTLGYFVGGASAAKGSLDRFGARRSGLGGFVAFVLLVVIVGGGSVSHQAGLVIFILGIVAAVLAAVGATLVSAPQPAPVPRGGLPRPVSPPKEAEAAPQEQIEAEYLEEPSTPRKSALAVKPAIRKAQVATPAPEPSPEPDAAAEPANWSLPEAAKPAARPRRDRPLRREDAAAHSEPEAPTITPPPAPRRRERSPKKGDQ